MYIYVSGGNGALRDGGDGSSCSGVAAVVGQRGNHDHRDDRGQQRSRQNGEWRESESEIGEWRDVFFISKNKITWCLTRADRWFSKDLSISALLRNFLQREFLHSLVDIG